MTSRPRRVLAALGAVTVLLGVAGCSADDPSATPSETTESAESTETAEPTTEPDGDGLQQFLDQQVEWTDCGGGFECGTVQVPVDYTDPDGDTIGLAVNRRAATDPDGRIGSLLLNPGGPGGSGVSYATQVADSFGADVMAAYDIVGFDPRAVASSEPLVCLGTEELDELIASDPDPDTDAEVEEGLRLLEDFGQACQDAEPELLPHLSTVDVARDLDVLRAVLGDDELHYFGASYGTYIGAVYAELFPENVGRMVLDGAVDPTLTNEESSLEQAAGFETALRAYVADCVQQEGCPLGSDVDAGAQQVADLLEQMDQEPLATGSDRELTQGLAIYGIVAPLYAEAAWPALTQALTNAFAGDGSTLLAFADLYLERSGGEYTSNQAQVISAVNCLDKPSDATVDEIEASVDEFLQASPTFGEIFAWSPLGCSRWPVEAASPVPDIDGKGAAPILVVGTTRDPATPYEGAVTLADLLDSGVLLTRDGDGHTAYNMGNACIDNAIDAYLAEGTVPDDGTTC